MKILFKLLFRVCSNFVENQTLNLSKIFIFILFPINLLCQTNSKIKYDSLNRIIEIVYSDSSKIFYSYDASGNRIAKTQLSGGHILVSNILSPICSGSTITFPYSITGNFGSSNSFTAQLSDTNGNFLNPMNIGSINSTNSGVIVANLSPNVLTDTRYKIRIIASNPKILSSDTGTDFVINHCAFNIRAKLFIEGYYKNNGTMNPVIVPVNNPSLCDTIILQLHSPIPPYQVLYSDKKIVQTDGFCDFNFTTTPEFGKYYLSLKHRNALETWSNMPFSISDSNSWFISENPNLIYGNKLKDLGDGHYALYSGDVDQNGSIDTNDFLEIQTDALLFLTGYLPEDLTGDKIIESTDYSLIENNLGKIVSRP